VAPGATLMDIVPHDTQLIVETKLPTKDIGYIKVGQKAVVRLASADAFKYGSLDGEVIAISPDTFTTAQGMIYYKVSISTGKTYFGNDSGRYVLSPGMPLEVSIQTGERTVLRYIFDPIMLGSREAMTER
jgi:membrane fusion protein, adhesin transport system